MAVLSEKLLKELPDDARVISCRFPILDWPVQSSVGSGLDQTFAYDIGIVRAHLRKAPEAEVWLCQNDFWVIFFHQKCTKTI